VIVEAWLEANSAEHEGETTMRTKFKRLALSNTQASSES